MQLIKTLISNANQTGELILNKTSINGLSVNELPENTGKIQLQPEIKNLASLIKSAGLPNDKLSSFILSLARFFSLPLKPDTMSDIRRFILMEQQAQPEILSLIKSAAESKGIEIQNKALDLFMEALDPDYKKQDENQNNKKQNDNDQKDRNNNTKNSENEKLNPVKIKEIALNSIKNNPVLSIFNKLPNKHNNHKWLVFPFEFNQNNKDYKVSMRVLMEGDCAMFLSLNIFTRCEKSENKCSFMIELSNNKINKICFYSSSEDQGKKQEKIKKELSDIFKILENKISVKSIEKDEIFIPEAEYGKELMQFINEEI